MLGTLFIICAVVGGTLFLCQFVLSLFSLGGHIPGVHHIPPGHLPGSGHGVPTTTHQGTLPGAGNPTGHGVAVRQAILHVLGHGHAGGRHESDSENSWLGAMLSFQGMVAALTVFGLAGMAAMSQSWAVWLVLPLALVSAIGASLMVATLLRTLMTMDSDGTVDIQDSIGSPGTVYLSILGGTAGIGKVLITVRDRTMEYAAITYQDADLHQGDAIVVVGVKNSDTLEVVSASSVPTRVDL